MPTEMEMIEFLQSGEVLFPMLSFRFIRVHSSRVDNRLFDAIVEISWRGNTARFIVELKSASTPKVFQNAVNSFKSSSIPKGNSPLLIVPFLSEHQLMELERQSISGLDLCGNCLLIAPGKFSVFRSGNRNRFPSTALIKNIYRKNSSMVGRVFLSGRTYSSVTEICSDINQRNTLVRFGLKKPMSLSTVSKSLKTLEDDLIIERNGSLTLLQSDKLLEKLRENYVSPKIRTVVRLKVSLDRESIIELLLKQSQMLNLPIIATGISSTTQYAVMQRGDILSVYCTNLKSILKNLPVSQSDRFPNLELIETKDERVYFDSSPGELFQWASPIQVYLELMDGDKRDQETAKLVKSLILVNSRGEQE
ncbi:MAG: hypothetical protein KAW14_00270 [Candidatus Aegiribacteria sp.]|nr:hypothetical protein [Candidatus Aegiribacteria sp.]